MAEWGVRGGGASCTRPRRPRRAGDARRLAPRGARQFAVRALAVITGLTLLLIVDVQGLASYGAWLLIVLGVLSEAAATLVYWRRARRGAEQ